MPSRATELVEGVAARRGGKNSTREGPRWWTPGGNPQRHSSQNLIVYRANSARGIKLAAGEKKRKKERERGALRV